MFLLGLNSGVKVTETASYFFATLFDYFKMDFKLVFLCRENVGYFIILRSCQDHKIYIVYC